jgi:hypothetical protein
MVSTERTTRIAISKLYREHRGTNHRHLCPIPWKSISNRFHQASFQAAENNTGVTYEERESLLKFRDLLFSKRISLPSIKLALMSIKLPIIVPAAVETKISRGRSPPFKGFRKDRTILD